MTTVGELQRKLSELPKDTCIEAYITFAMPDGSVTDVCGADIGEVKFVAELQSALIVIKADEFLWTAHEVEELTA